ncbi:MAG TPA: hypothetical protein VHJ78_10780, partial [Actinomycetota bacterium]|nr:hypothetical protein [Actinomycetota bacterium]
TMELLGDANWYLPRWLDRLLPNIHIEGKSEEASPAPDALVTGAFEPVPSDAVAPSYATVQPRADLSPAWHHSAYPVYATEDDVDPEPPARRSGSTRVPASGEPEWMNLSDELPDIPGRDGRRPRHPTRPSPAWLGAVPARTQPPSELERLLRDLPFRAGKGDVRVNLEEVARTTYRHFQSDGGGYPALDISRLSGYLTLEQRMGRIARMENPEHVAQLLMGALAAQALTADGDEEDSDQFARDAVKIVLEGIGKRQEVAE